MRPKVFVSSTFFDLRQVRTNIREFIEGLGYEPLLSEDQSFPIDTGLTTIENCRRRVERDADLFVLIVGMRYGSRAPGSDHSVTNIEYLAARAKGIPIYVFMEKRLEVLLDLWKENPTLNPSLVDSPDLFRFADQIRNTDKVWTSSFERADQIIDRLSAQFAYTMTEALKWQRRLNQRPLGSYVRKLSGLSLRVALEQPPGWEYLLLAQVIRDEVAEHRHLREEHDEALALELGEDVADPIAWSNQRFHELRRLSESIVKVVTTVGARALGPPGESGDLDGIVFTGQAFGRLHKSALQWSRRIRTANLPEEMNAVRATLARFTDDVIAQIERLADQIQDVVTDVSATPGDGEPRHVTITLKISIGDELIEQYSLEMERLRQRIGENGGWS